MSLFEMVAAWNDLDEGWDDEALWWAALAAEPPGGMPGILERAAAARPAWHGDAACHGRPELSWFSAADQAATTAICATCPARAPCAEAGRLERFGVWGGQAQRLAAHVRAVDVPGAITTAGPVPAPPEPRAKRTLVAQSGARPARAGASGARAPSPCSDCGERPAASRGLCRRCYSRALRREAGAKPRRKGKLVAACVDCSQERPIQGRGLCAACHSRWLRRRAGVPAKRVGPKIAACAGCGEVGPIRCVGLCRRCYGARRRGRER